MKYQFYVIAKPDPDCGEEYRAFSVPVREIDGQWVPCGKPYEETHLHSRPGLGLHVVSYDPASSTCGPLGGIECPPGWEVMSRTWLPDDYTPPSAAEMRHRMIDAARKLKDMGVIDQDFDPIGEQG